MNLYTIALFAHFLGFITLFGAFVLHWRADRRLRMATNMDQARECIAFLNATGPMFPAGSLFLVLSGLYMTSVQWSFRTPWIVIALAGVVAMAVAGGAAGSRQGRALETKAPAASGPIPADLAEVIRRRGPEIVNLTVNGGALGIVWIMAAKPGWAGSIAALVVGVAAGAVFGLLAVRRV
jgi:hypothetical protein